jgi:hypothetical protein
MKLRLRGPSLHRENDARFWDGCRAKLGILANGQDPTKVHSTIIQPPGQQKQDVMAVSAMSADG